MGNFCTGCGAPLNEGAAFCNNCGTPAGGQPAQQPQNTANQNFNYQQMPQNNFNQNYNYQQMPQNNFNQNPYYQQPVGNMGQNAYYQQPPQNFGNRIYSETEFFDAFVSGKSKSWIKAQAIICAFTAAISIVPVFLGNFFGIIDIVIYAAFAAVLFMKKNWGISLAATCYSALGTLLGLALTQTPSGLFALVCSIMATVYLKRASDAYKLYKTTGRLPTAQI